MVEFQDIAKVAKQHPQIFHAGLGMLLQLEWEYLQRKVHGIGSLMEILEAALREAFFHSLFGGEEVNDDLREFLGHSVKHGGLGIPEPRRTAVWGHETSVTSCEALLESLLGVSDHNCVGNWYCVRTDRVGERK